MTLTSRLQFSPYSHSRVRKRLGCRKYLHRQFSCWGWFWVRPCAGGRQYTHARQHSRAAVTYCLSASASSRPPIWMKKATAAVERKSWLLTHSNKLCAYGQFAPRLHTWVCMTTTRNKATRDRAGLPAARSTVWVFQDVLSGPG